MLFTVWRPVYAARQSEVLLRSSGRHSLIDDVGSRSRSIQEFLFVLDNSCADPRFGELGHPCLKRWSIGKSQFRHYIEINLATFRCKPLADEISTLVDGGNGRQAANQRNMLALVVVDELFLTETIFLRQKSKYPEHRVL